LGAVIIGCVVYGIQLGWGCMVCGLVCLTSLGSLRGCCSRWGFFWASGFHSVCARAWLGACVFMIGINLTIILSTHNEDDTPQNSEDLT